ncbi:MAG: exodeoxyribonuclease VII large subunit [Lactobacillales bacterium]|jgi:exodeoxyribonuclease VII large subunit|nr:exodeoxyribonuclease VII large subunit [Lactobacillales bacterium]
MRQENYLSVSALTQYIKTKFDRDPYLERVFLVGEISNFRLRPKHQYFSLKDEKAVIQATMWVGLFSKLRFQPEEGMKVLAIGRISVYEPNGSYSIILEHMEPDGIGALSAALQKSKEKLEQEGLFQEKHKQPIPRFPKRIAILTSPSGAVIRDIIITVRRRFPIAQLVLFPTIVQGNSSATSIVANIDWVDKLGTFDTLILGRGGGSIEDLWSFNEESVVRAIFNAKTPIISSIGHETDTTLADFVSDKRAATPTAAAEIATPVLDEIILQLQKTKQILSSYFQGILKSKQERLLRLQQSYVFQQPMRLYEKSTIQLDQTIQMLITTMNQKLQAEEKRLMHLQSRLKEHNPKKGLFVAQQNLQFQIKTLQKTMKYYLEQKKTKFVSTLQALDFLSPLKTMGRGFTYTTNTKKQLIKTINDLKKNEKLLLHYNDGIVKVNVLEIMEENNE